MKIYITFGQNHIHRINGKILDHDCLAAIEAKNHAGGRVKAFELFDRKFCTTYGTLESAHLEYYPRGIIEI
jgi:hypothetical protein